MDDIDYLIKNSEKDSSLFIIDSSHRNRHKYPTPSEYVIEFSQPYRFVFGFDIIDATIPSTMYSIDAHNNVLCLGICTMNTNNDDPYETLMEYMHSEFHHAYANQRLPLVKFAFMESHSLQVNIDSKEAILNSKYVFVTKSSVIPVDERTYQEYLERRKVMHVLDCYRVVIEPGNYNINTLMTYLKKNLRQYGIDVRPATIDILVEKQMKYKFVSFDQEMGVSYPFFLDMEKSTCGEIIGFDQLSSSPSEGYFKDVSLFKQPTSTSKLFGSLRGEDGVHSVVAPGVVNLLGVRYVTLRCPEIESHLLGSLGYTSNNIGLGIFKLQSPYEVSNLKFDFFNFVKKPFHPIGKLTKMSIRFEREDGILYNFRGINHQILISIKYYIPSFTAMVKDPVHILNPNYNPNYLDYLVEREEKLNDDDDDDSDYDDEEQVDGPNMLQRYVFMKNNGFRRNPTRF